MDSAYQQISQQDYCAGYNEESPEALLCFGEKITRVSTCFSMVL